MTGIEPLGEMVLVEMEKAAEKTTSGLLIPEAAREKMNVGVVVSAGPEAEIAGISDGDRVVYRKYSGTEMEWEGNEYLLVKSEDIQAKIK